MPKEAIIMIIIVFALVVVPTIALNHHYELRVVFHRLRYKLIWTYAGMVVSIKNFFWNIRHKDKTTDFEGI